MNAKCNTILIGSRHDMVAINIYHVIAIVAHDSMDIGDTVAKCPTFADADRVCVAHNRTHGPVCDVVDMR